MPRCRPDHASSPWRIVYEISKKPEEVPEGLLSRQQVLIWLSKRTGITSSSRGAYLQYLLDTGMLSRVSRGRYEFQVGRFAAYEDFYLKVAYPAFVTRKSSDREIAQLGRVWAKASFTAGPPPLPASDLKLPGEQEIARAYPTREDVVDRRAEAMRWLVLEWFMEAGQAKAFRGVVPTTRGKIQESLRGHELSAGNDAVTEVISMLSSIGVLQNARRGFIIRREALLPAIPAIYAIQSKFQGWGFTDLILQELVTVEPGLFVPSKPLQGPYMDALPKPAEFPEVLGAWSEELRARLDKAMENWRHRKATTSE